MKHEYEIKFIYNSETDTLMAYTDDEGITESQRFIQAHLGEDVALEIADFQHHPVFSAVQITNASFVPFWTEPLSQFLTEELLTDFIMQFNYLFKRAVGEHEERTVSFFPRLSSIIINRPKV